MKIGIVTSWSERGAAYVSRQLMNTLKKDFELFIYARGGEKYEIGNPKWDLPNVFWSTRKKSRYSTALNIKELKKWIINNNIEIVIFNEQRDWEPVLELKKMKVKIGAYIDYYTEETIPLFEIYDFLICNTKRHYSVFKWHSGATYIPWGTDIDLFNPNSKKERDAVKTDSRVVFFHSAGMSPSRKGTKHVLKAFQAIDHTKAKLIIHSQINICNYFNDDQEIKETIKKLKSLDALEIINKTVTSPGLYYKGDVYLYPSLLDGLGLTVAEALASGLPTITTNSAPMNEFINPGVTGELIAVEKFYARSDGYYWPQSEVDTNDFIDKINKIIDNQEKLFTLQENAREYAVKELDWKKNSIKLIKLMRNLNHTELNKNTVALINKYQAKHLPFRKIPILEFAHYFVGSIYKKRF